MSLRRHAPGLPILASCPGASPDFVSWVSGHTDLVQTDPEFGGLGWNVKPRLLLRAMESTSSAVLWLDADVIVTGEVEAVMPRDLSVLVAAEEFALAQTQGSEARTTAWALEPGRRLASTANTSVLRVSGHHVGLLERWAELLERPDYRATQQSPALERPLHMLGDQDALTALLGSREHDRVPVHLLRRGREIAQCGSPAGYLPSERVRGLWRPLPVFVHSAGVKPWQHGARWRHSGSRVARVRASYEDAHIRLSPYTILARELSESAGLDIRVFGAPSAMEQILLTSGRRWPQVPELPLAVFDSLARRLRARLALGRYGTGAATK